MLKSHLVDTTRERTCHAVYMLKSHLVDTMKERTRHAVCSFIKKLLICSKIALLGQGDRVLMMVVMIHLVANMATGEGRGKETRNEFVSAKQRKS